MYDPNVSPLFQSTPTDPHWASEPRYGLGDGPLFSGAFNGAAPHESLADACDAIAATNGTYLDAEIADLLSAADSPPVAADIPYAAPDTDTYAAASPYTTAPHAADLHAAGPHSHRKTARLPFRRVGKSDRTSKGGCTWKRLLSLASVVLTTALVAAVGILGAAASYPALHGLASGVAPGGVALLWPLLVYGPWLAATLSILRARAYRRRTVHSWCVIILFAAIAMALCIIHAPTTPAGIIVAGLPPVTVLLCFHQLIRQLDLTPGPPPTTRHASTARGTHRQRITG
ncbi:DUF2637 domain-containing protein [Streptomyces sp. NPDC057654]|uniref:DUF2637 domain-containing protein n=1 Tax=Streptomyces sp. NPDC057654 TaxID=3346196 RepID=UPI0036984D54